MSTHLTFRSYSVLPYNQGWEETVNASVTFLLKTTLAKTAKEGTSSLSGTTLEVRTGANLVLCF
jgi:hypothetical protein